MNIKAPKDTSFSDFYFKRVASLCQQGTWSSPPKLNFHFAATGLSRLGYNTQLYIMSFRIQLLE
jgi:hypothetical protein